MNKNLILVNVVLNQNLLFIKQFYSHILNKIKMKKVTLTIKEWYLFKQLANFFFEITIHKDRVEVIAEETLLSNLGY